MVEENNPEWSCLPNYINLYHYCKQLLVNVIYKKKVYRIMINSELNKSLLGSGLTLKNIYDIFGLAYYDNLIKYFPFFISPNPEHHALPTKIYNTTKKYLFESICKYDGTKEIKYPLNFVNFRQLIGDLYINS